MTFNIDNGGSIVVYKTHDYSLPSDISSPTVARTSETGLIDVSGDSQVNFKVVVPSGYKIDSIVIDWTYKNLKEIEDTNIENLYHITKIKSDLSITITLIKDE